MGWRPIMSVPICGAGSVAGIVVLARARREGREQPLLDACLDPHMVNVSGLCRLKSLRRFGINMTACQWRYDLYCVCDLDD